MIHSCKECVPEGSDYFQLTLGRRRSSTHKKRRRIWEQLKIKLSPFKEDPSSNEEYEKKNSIVEEPLIHLIIWIRNDDFMKEEYDKAE